MTTVCPVCNSSVQPGDAACPSCGFKLKGSTEEFQPIAVEGQGQKDKQAQPKTVTRATMTVVRGPQIGTVYQLDDKQLTIGRSPQCDIFLNDMSVSRAHAFIAPKNGSFQITDRQSYNGIWVNNTCVDETILADGDIVQIGAFCLEYSM